MEQILVNNGEKKYWLKTGGKNTGNHCRKNSDKQWRKNTGKN